MEDWLWDSFWFGVETLAGQSSMCLTDRWVDAVGRIIKDYSWAFCPGTQDEEEEGASRSLTPPPPVRECVHWMSDRETDQISLFTSNYFYAH